MHHRLVTAAIALAVLLPARAMADDDPDPKITIRTLGDAKGAKAVFGSPVQVLAWSWGASRSGPKGPSNMQDISFTKYVGLESPTLVAMVANGGTLPKVVLEVRLTDITTITLYDAYVSSVSTGGSGGESRMTENVTLGYAAYEIETQVTDAGGLKQTRSSGKITIPPPPP